MSLNHELADLFRTFAAIMEIKGEAVFKAIAFSKVSRILGDMTFDVRDCVDKGTLDEIEGIGNSSRRIIEEYCKTGRSTDFDEVYASIPPGLVPMLQIPGLGPKTIAMFWKQRNITSIDELIKAIADGSLQGLKGIGDKKLESIKQGIEMREQAAKRMGIGEALPVAEQLLARVRELKQVKQAEIAGSLRRRKETIGDVDLVCACADGVKGSDITAKFVKFPEVSKVLGEGTTKASIVTAGGLQVDLRVVPVENFGAALLYFTGSKDHNVRIRGLAQDKGMTLNEWGLYKIKDYEKLTKKSGEPPREPLPSSPSEREISSYINVRWEFKAFEVLWSDEEATPFLEKMRVLWSARSKGGRTAVENLLCYLEDRLMIEFPDKGNPTQRNWVPQFNHELPKSDSTRILSKWSSDAPKELRDFVADVLSNMQAPNWLKESESVSKLPGIYVFRETGSEKIVYVGMAGWRDGKGLRERLNLHLNGSCTNSSLRKHIREWLADHPELRHRGRTPGLVASQSEAAIYENLGMVYVEPEMREDHGEVDLALKNKLPELIKLDDYRGDLHCHTTASDGTASIEQMAEAAIARGYEFLAITDHSKSQVIANGLSAERLLEHAKEIRKVSGRMKKIKLLAGVEVDILVDGKLDFEDAVLKELDFVVASPHVSLKQDAAKATDRIVRAIENRYVNVIGHPTGRLINSRAGLPLEFSRVYKAAEETGTALEINAGYPRLDLNDVHARGAIESGVMLAIDTDAHSIQGFDEIHLGLSVARRASAMKQHVINCMNVSQLLKFVAAKR